MGRDVRMCAVFLRDHQKRRARPVYLANTPNRKPHFFRRFKGIEKMGREREIARKKEKKSETEKREVAAKRESEIEKR